MTLSDYYENTRQTIFEQRLQGTYTKSRPSQSYKIILALGIANLLFGAYTLFIYLNLNVITTMYSTDIQNTVFIPKGRSYIYIGLEGVYQNYLSYTKSISYKQLNGEAQFSGLSSTKPFDYLENKPFYPAGAIAATYFQDQIILDNLEIQTEGIARNSEINYIGMTEYNADQIAIPENWTVNTNKGTYPLNTAEGSSLPILNERFVNWINLSAFPNFKKLWGIVDVEESGNYNLSILSTYELASKKEVVISEKSMLGIPNYFAVASMFIIGILSIVGAIYLKNRGY